MSVVYFGNEKVSMASRAGGRMMNEQVRLVAWPMMHKLAGHGNKFQQPFQLCLFGSVVQPHSVF